MIVTLSSREVGSLLKQQSNFHTVCKRWVKYKRERFCLQTLQPDYKADGTEIPINQYASDSTNRLYDRIYVWGFGLSGALGIPYYCKPAFGMPKMHFCFTPRKLGCFHYCKVKDVACGHGFTIFAAKYDNVQTQLFGTGVNSDGQLGYHTLDKKPLVILSRPAPIYFPANLENPDIKQVAAGRSHTIILSTNNKLYSLGNNAFGQCGVPISAKKNNETFTRFNTIEGISGRIKKVVCGQDHTLFLTEDGEVYSCGWGADGQTGLGHYDNTAIPTKLKGDIDGEKIVEIASSADGTLACNDDGDVFCWGNSEYAQFSLVTDEYQVNVPRRLPISVGKVVKVAAGGTMCGVLNDKGEVYVWGFGILGQGPKVEHLSKPSLLPPPLFGCNAINPDIKVTSIHAGLSRWAATNSNGDLFCWGRNKHGCLGFKDGKDRYFPLKVILPVNVRKVSLGVDHTAIIGRTII